MKTLIISDMHLNAENTRANAKVVQWLDELLQRISPDRVVFNGDTFELSFSALYDPGSEPTARRLLPEILSKLESFFLVMRKQTSVKEVVYVTGEHDYQIKSYINELQSFHDGIRVQVEDEWFDRPSGLLALHGHQFDYNVTNTVIDGEVLTDKLTEIFESFVYQSSRGRLSMIRDAAVGDFSYWYGAGALPDYIRGVANKYGHDPMVYYKGLRRLLRSRYFRLWLAQQPFSNYVAGKFLASVSFFSPRILFRFDRYWWRVAQKIYDQRLVQVLKCRLPSPFLMSNYPDLKVLSIGHEHKVRDQKISINGITKRIINTVAPHRHVYGLSVSNIYTKTESLAVLIDDTAVYTVGAEGDYVLDDNAPSFALASP